MCFKHSLKIMYKIKFSNCKCLSLFKQHIIYCGEISSMLIYSYSVIGCVTFDIIKRIWGAFFSFLEVDDPIYFLHFLYVQSYGQLLFIICIQQCFSLLFDQTCLCVSELKFQHIIFFSGNKAIAMACYKTRENKTPQLYYLQFVPSCLARRMKLKSVNHGHLCQPKYLVRNKRFSPLRFVRENESQSRERMKRFL